MRKRAICALVFGSIPPQPSPMPLFRIDRYKANPADSQQQLGYADWIGGPTLSNVKGAIIAGTNPPIRRAARITGEPDTFFSAPAQASINGRTVKGWIGCDDGVYIFHPYKCASVPSVR